MRFKLSIATLVCALVAVPATAQIPPPQPQPASPQIIAQALDRCMATYAVRLTRTEATDEAIYREAAQSCQPLKDRLATVLRAQLAPAQATEILQELDAAAKPNFMAMLARIRSDRAARPGGE